MKFSSKRTISRLVAVSMLASSMLSNVMVASADVDFAADAVASGSAVEAQLDGITIIAEDFKDAHPDGLVNGDDLGNGISILNGGSAFAFKNVTYTFNDGEYSIVKDDVTDAALFRKEFQLGNGNANLASTLAVGDTVDPTGLEKGFMINATGAGTFTVYAGLGSSGKSEAPVILVDAATMKVADAGVITRPGGAGDAHTVPTFNIPAAGTYVFLQPGKVSSLNVAAINLNYGAAPVETTTEATTAAPVETTEATTDAPTEATTEAPVPSEDVMIIAENFKDAHPDGLVNGDDLGNGVSILNGGSAFAFKNVTYTFNGGEYSIAKDDVTDAALFRKEFQLGNGNANLASTLAVGDTVDPTGLEKGFMINATGAGTFTVYAGLGSSGKSEAPVILVDAATMKVVDAGVITRPGGTGDAHTVPTLNIPAAGTYVFLQPGKVSSLNVAAIKMTSGAAPVETTTEATTEATTVATTEETTEATTTAPIGENEVGFKITATQANGKVTATYEITDNSAAKGFNNYTITLNNSDNLTNPVLTAGNITMEATDALGNKFPVNAGAAKLSGNKIAYCIWTDGSAPADGSGTQLPEFTDNGVLFTITYDMTGTEATLDATVDTINTVSSNDAIAGAVTAVVTPATVKVDEESTEASTEESTEASTEATTEEVTEETTEATTEEVTEETTEATTEEVTDETTEATTEAATEATTNAPIVTTEATTNAPATTEATTEVTTAARRPSSGGGGGGGSNSYKPATTTTTVATTEASPEATTETAKPSTPALTLTKDIRVTIDQKSVMIGDQGYGVDVAPYIQAASNSTLVPLRVVAIAILGEDVQSADQLSNIVKWDNATKTATIIAGNSVVMFTAGSDTMIVDGRAKLMDNGVKAEIKDSRMYVPFRALGEALGVEVDWDADTRTAIYKANVVETTTEATTEETTAAADEDSTEETTAEDTTVEATTETTTVAE